MSRKAAVRAMLLMLRVTWVSCSRHQQGAAGDSVSQPPASESMPASLQLVGLLPQDAGVPGWSRSRPPRHFGPDNLREYIDGAAESRLALGFAELATAE